MKKQWFVVLIFVFSVTILFPYHSMAEDEVKIGYLGFVLALPTFVALEKGYFQEQGLKANATLFESGTIITDALITGRIDVQTGSAIIASWLAEQNMPGTYKIFIMYGNRAVLQDNTMALMVAKDSPLKGITDLKGKRMGTFPGIASIALAKAVLRNSFDPDKEITFIEVPPGNIVQALAAGQIDAYFAPEPFGMIGEAKGVGRRLVKSPLLLLNLKTGIPGAPFSFEFVTLVGPNGCGKTTIFRIIAGLEDREYGKISIGGKPSYEAKIGYIFQNYRESLYPWRTCFDNLLVPLELNKVPRKERKKRVEQFLFNLDFKVQDDAYPYQLSGGQQQLLCILRSLLYEPDVLLMDEPFSSLDFQTTLYMHDKVLDIWAKAKATILFISHDINEAVYLADKVVVLSKRPARVMDVIEVDLPRPRKLEMTESEEFFAVRNRVLDIFKDEIADSLIRMEMSGF